VIETGYWAGVGVGLTCAVVVAFVSGPVPGLLSGLAGGLGATHIAHRGPVWLASLRRTRALGAAPGLVGRLVLRMRLDPSTERAVRFAARTGDGPLADGLARHERANTDGPTSGLRAFAREWQPWFPAIDRAAALVRTAASAPPERRGGVWTARSMQQFPERRTDLPPSSGSPQPRLGAVRVRGVASPCAHCSPSGGCRDGRPNRSRRRRRRCTSACCRRTGLLAASAWLLSRRPVAFAPPSIDEDHPDVPERNSRRGRRIGNRSHRRRRYSAVRLRMGRSGRRGRRRSRRRAVRCRSPPQSGAVERPCRRALPPRRDDGDRRRRGRGRRRRDRNCERRRTTRRRHWGSCSSALDGGATRSASTFGRRSSAGAVRRFRFRRRGCKARSRCSPSPGVRASRGRRAARTRRPVGGAARARKRCATTARDRDGNADEHRGGVRAARRRGDSRVGHRNRRGRRWGLGAGATAAQTRSAVPVVSVTRAQSVPKRAERRAGRVQNRTAPAHSRCPCSDRSSARTC